MSEETALVEVNRTKLDGMVNAFKETASKITLAVADVKITDQDSLDAAVELRKKAYGTGKSMEEARKFFVDPLRKHVDDINAVFKPLTLACKDGVRAIDGKVMTFEDAVRQVAAEEEAKLAERAEKKQEKALDKADRFEEEGKIHQADAARTKAAATVAPKVVAPKATGVHRRRTWQVRIKDPVAFLKAAYDQTQRDLYPGEVRLAKYIIFDEAALKKLATSSEGEVTMPGIEFYQDEKMVGR